MEQAIILLALLTIVTGANITTSGQASGIPDISSCMTEAARIVTKHYQSQIDALINENGKLRDVNTKLDKILSEIVSSKSEKDVFGSGRNCTIRHRLYEHELYAAGLNYDADQRHVFTWMRDPPNNYLFWDIERVQSGRYPLYKLRNIYFNEYLYAAEREFGVDSLRRSVFTSRKREKICDENCVWDIQVVREGRYNYFTIQNADLGEYLYTNDGGVYKYDENRRNVFTWHARDESRDNQQLHWKIECS